MYTVQNLENDLTGILHGTTLDQVTGVNNLIYRAARQLLLDVDPQETKRTVQLSPVFQDVFDYPLLTIAPDLKGQKVVDIRPIPTQNRQAYDNYTQAYTQDFDIGAMSTNIDAFTVNFNTGIKTIRVNDVYAPNAPIQINACDYPTDNGTWTVFGGASNLQTDNVNYINGTGGALEFTLASTSSSGGIVNSTSAAVNLSLLVGQGSMFLFGYFPVASAVTSVQLKWGSDASDYYSVTATQSQAGTAFANGWNLLQFPMVNAVSTGTPNPASITYVQVTVNYSSSSNLFGVHINNIFAGLPSILEMVYYSKYLFQNAVTGAWQETVTDPSNIINLDTESYNLLFNICGYLLAQQQQGLDSLFYDASFFENAYNQGIQRYQAMYKSEVKLPHTSYYRMPNPQPTQWWNNRFQR